MRRSKRAAPKQFKDAPVLGSLINPEASLDKGSLFELNWEELDLLMTKALSGENEDEENELGVVAKGLVKAASLLKSKYELLMVNPPYLVLGKQSDRLKEFASEAYPDSRNDLATVFISRCIEFLSRNGFICLVSPQNWLFQPRYKDFRRRLLGQNSVNFVAKLGAGAFEAISGEIVKVTLAILNAPNANAESLVKNIDISLQEENVEKAELLQTSQITTLPSIDYLKTADSRIIATLHLESKRLSSYATTLHGQNAGDNSVFNRYFWEVPKLGDVWKTYQNAPAEGEIFSGRSQIVMWENENGRMARFAESVRHLNHKAQQWRSGKPNWSKKGIALSLVGRIYGTLYEGDIYGVLCGVIIPNNIEHLGAMWAFVKSGEMERLVRVLDTNLAIQAKTLLAVPFELDYWTQVAAEQFPNGLPKPYSNDPTQWVFHGHPAQSDAPLQVAMARLLGYRWPAGLDKDMELSDDARELARQSEALLPYADADGIVCIPPVRGEMKAEDRLENLLAVAYGGEWSSNKKAELLAQADHDGKTLETWLRDKFFAQHCKLFNNRPFIWHIWDGLRDGFAALVNYHKLDAKLLETLIYTYLGDWISRQKQDKANGVDGSEEKLAAAEVLKKRLELIMEGETPYDIFVRWKSLEEQPIGWNPDLNDGVRLNIRPFLSVPDVGKKGAGVLRDKPNIKWEKDRGKDVESAPWYGVFKGDRINDHHLTLAEKRAARTAMEKGAGQ